jgi:large subunit ribosomal protein L5
MSRLQEQYNSELHGQIMQKLGLKNAMEVPRITKITLNMGVGEAVADKKVHVQDSRWLQDRLHGYSAS